MNIMNKLKNNLSIVIMAAGKGTRMNSDLPKVLHELSGDTLLNHVIATAKKLHPTNTVVIVGHEAEIVKKSVLSNNVLFSLQKEQHGTGHAVIQAKNHLQDFDGNTLILSGDVPLIKTSTLFNLIQNHENGLFDASMITADFNNPDGYGRVIRNFNGNLEKVQEHKDCNNEQLQIKEINSGIYIFNNQILFELLPELSNSNEQLEYYLPDVLSMIVSNGGKIGLEKIKNINEIQGVNTLDQLSYLESIYEKNN